MTRCMSFYSHSLEEPACPYSFKYPSPLHPPSLQEWPKSCGHVGRKRVVGREEALARVRAACDARCGGRCWWKAWLSQTQVPLPVETSCAILPTALAHHRALHSLNLT